MWLTDVSVRVIPTPVQSYLRSTNEPHWLHFVWLKGDTFGCFVRKHFSAGTEERQSSCIALHDARLFQPTDHTECIPTKDVNLWLHIKQLHIQRCLAQATHCSSLETFCPRCIRQIQEVSRVPLDWKNNWFPWMERWNYSISQVCKQSLRAYHTTQLNTASFIFCFMVIC